MVTVCDAKMVLISGENIASITTHVTTQAHKQLNGLLNTYLAL